MGKIREDSSNFANTLIAIRISLTGTGKRQKKLSAAKFPSPGAESFSACLHAHKRIRHRGIRSGAKGSGFYGKRDQDF